MLVLQGLYLHITQLWTSVIEKLLLRWGLKVQWTVGIQFVTGHCSFSIFSSRAQDLFSLLFLALWTVGLGSSHGMGLISNQEVVACSCSTGCHSYYVLQAACCFWLQGLQLDEIHDYFSSPVACVIPCSTIMIVRRVKKLLVGYQLDFSLLGDISQCFFSICWEASRAVGFSYGCWSSCSRFPLFFYDIIP